MKKIEKLKIPNVKHQIGLRELDGSNFIELKMVGEKINEIIDRLNEQSEERTLGKWEELETAINIFKNRNGEIDEIGFRVDGKRFVIREEKPEEANK